MEFEIAAPVSAPEVLALDGASTAKCVEQDNKWQLVNAAATPIGTSVETEQECSQLAASAQDALICAWTGDAILPARLTDGAPIGASPDIGAKTLQTCAAMLGTAKAGVMCSWTANGFKAFVTQGAIHEVGSGKASVDLDNCAARIQFVGNGQLCSSDGRDISIFDVASNTPQALYGTFSSYDSCNNVLAQIQDPAARDQYLSALKEAAVSDPSAANPEQADADTGIGLTGSGGWTWGDCRDPGHAHHLVKSVGTVPVCHNKIDTLYTWGPTAKIEWLKTQPWSGRFNRNGKPDQIFSTQSSYATFGYGDHSIRIRLKDGVKFHFFEYTQVALGYQVCDRMSAAEQENTVAVYYWKGGAHTGTDYILCTMGPVHSWSYGTKNHYREMSRELEWVLGHNYRNYELYVKKVETGIVDILPFLKDQAQPFTKENWRKNLQVHAAMEPGNIYYNPSAGSKSEDAHFRARWSTYINP